jgi:hypothetical protein
MHAQILQPSCALWQESLDQLRHDVYHLPAYVNLEAKRTQTQPSAFVAIEGDRRLFLPYLLRSCAPWDKPLGEAVFDAISPYGYPGLLLSGAAQADPDFFTQALMALKQALLQSNVCSVFLRSHPILHPQIQRSEPAEPGDALVQTPELQDAPLFQNNGQTVSVDLTLSEAEIWAHTRKGHQSTINKGRRLGFEPRMVPLETHFDAFLEIYQETMDRVGAKQEYYFDPAYFDQLRRWPEHLHLGVVELDGEVICASLFFECCNIVQAHLGGTKTSFLRQSPFNLLLHYVRLWAKERGNQFLHLGGGLGGSQGDSLYVFKSGFSRQRQAFFTSRWVLDSVKYDALVAQRAIALQVSAEQLVASGFFPAYRAM